MRNQIIVLAVLLAGCSSAQRVEHIHTDMDVKGQLADQKIGIDEKGQAIVQQETAADIELRNIRWRTYDLEKQIASDHEYLERCQNEISDPRLGGTGQVTDIPEIDASIDTSKVKKELGLAEDNSLKVVRKELLTDRLAQEGKYETTLKTLSSVVLKHKKKCERELGYARTKHGLPAERFKSTGHYGEGGSWIHEKDGENNLDDAFRIAASH